jgi:GT2 family glycosyltransferase/lipopolysaccharide/colanic/teichoic acid biosynthesis glycosyltransferase
MKELSIIIVNYNVKAFLQNCLLSIRKAIEKIDSEIIIVDNASDDGSVELIKKNFPEIKLIESQTNLGFSKANNLGLKVSQGKYICLINPDTIVEEDTFRVMIAFMESNPEVGLAGCKILNPDGTFQLACRRSFPTPWVAFTKIIGLSRLFPKSKLFARYNLTYLDENQSYEVDAVSGSFMFLRREVYEKIGGLDETFFMYGEDLDYCYRVKQAGYKVYYVHSTQIIHFKGESTKRSNIDELKHFYDAMRLFVRKHFSGSWIIELILQAAINIRSLLAFFGKRSLILIAMIVDFILFNISVIVSELIYIKISGFSGFPDYAYPIVFIVPAGSFILIAYLLDSYQIKNLPISKLYLSLLISFLFTSSLTYFFKDYAFSRAILLITYVFLFFLLPGWRILLKIIFKYPKDSRQSLFEANTLIVGTNDAAIELLNRLRKSYTYYYEVVGFIDLDRKRIGEKINDVEIIGSIDTLGKIIRDKGITEVIFASDFLPYNKILSIVSENQNQNIHFHLVDKNYDFIISKKDVLELNELPLIEIEYNISMPIHRFIKRTFDIVLGMFLLFTLYPIFLIRYLVSKKWNNLLYLFKVLGGKFSFVGRPIGSRESNIYLGKPGLTGIVQINENKNLSEDEIERLNIYYAKNQNIWLDIEILIKTIQNYLR